MEEMARRRSAIMRVEMYETEDMTDEMFDEEMDESMQDEM